MENDKLYISVTHIDHKLLCKLHSHFHTKYVVGISSIISLNRLLITLFLNILYAKLNMFLFTRLLCTDRVNILAFCKATDYFKNI